MFHCSKLIKVVVDTKLSMFKIRAKSLIRIIITIRIAASYVQNFRMLRLRLRMMISLKRLILRIICPKELTLRVTVRCHRICWTPKLTIKNANLISFRNGRTNLSKNIFRLTVCYSRHELKYQPPFVDTISTHIA